MNNKIFDSKIIVGHLTRLGKIILCLLVAMLIAALVGCGFASGNPFAIFFPSTWINFFKFLS